MAQQAITRSDLDADQARQETTFATAMFQLERRMYATIALSTAITIGALGLIIALT